MHKNKYSETDTNITTQKRTQDILDHWHRCQQRRNGRGGGHSLYWDGNKAQIHKHKCTNTNAETRWHRYKYIITNANAHKICWTIDTDARRGGIIGGDTLEIKMIMQRNIPTQRYKYKYTNTNTQSQIGKHKKILDYWHRYKERRTEWGKTRFISKW